MMYSEDRMSLRNLFGPRFGRMKLTLKLIVRNPSSAIGLAVVLIYGAIAVIDQFYPHLLGIYTNVNVMSVSFSSPLPQPPSWLANIHDWSLALGTTYPGINLLMGILKAIRIDIGFSVAIVAGGSLLGIIIGLYAGYFGGIVDEVLMRVTDIFFSIPFLVIAIAAGFFLGRSLIVLLFVLIIIWWPTYARVVRGQVLSIKELPYVEASRANGVSTTKTIFRHILPNTLAPVIVQVSFDLATVVILLATLDFIGFIPSNAYLPELGYLSSIGYSYAVIGDWWTMVFPGLAILLFALAMNLLGDGIRDAFDPKLRR